MCQSKGSDLGPLDEIRGREVGRRQLIASRLGFRHEGRKSHGRSIVASQRQNCGRNGFTNFDAVDLVAVRAEFAPGPAEAQSRASMQKQGRARSEHHGPPGLPQPGSTLFARRAGGELRMVRRSLSMLLTASKMAACSMAKLRVECIVGGWAPGVRTIDRRVLFHSMTGLTACVDKSAG